MSDALLPYYNRELVAIRRLAAEFAEANPKIAGRLRLSRDAVDDPLVARLLDGVAFLAARVQHRLDDEFPELTDALLGVLYPHYLAPFPSTAVVQFAPQPDLAGPARIGRFFPLDTEPVRGETCRFRTAYETTLWPVEIEAVRLSGLPLAAPANPRAAGAMSVLRITLRTASPDKTFAELGLDRLRLFLRAAPNIALPLYELLAGHTLGVAYADGPADAAAALAGPEAIEPVGFAPEEALLPWPARSFSGFRLLSEYFAAPEKFLFLDVTGIEAKTRSPSAPPGNRLDIFVYLDQALPDLERMVGADALALGCTPVVNLFAQRCDPIPLTQMTTEYRIVPDARRPAAFEVWSVERVRESHPDGTSRPWRPFYRMTHGDPEAQAEGGFYLVARRDSPAPMRGSEVYLAPFDPALDPDMPSESVLSVDVLCSNRDLPTELPFGGGHPRLRLAEGAAAVARATCLTAPTAPARMKLREHGFWRLISHLSLGHLSVVGEAEGANALKEVLRLYDLRDSAESRAAIGGLLAVHAQPGAARVPGARVGAFCRGLDVTLEFDQHVWQTSGLFLMAAVLDRFLGLHASVNAFVRTRAVLRGRAGSVAAFPPRAGTRTLL
ncbi:MAG: type VI secretion system baseplate subunit TssF [Rhodospirillales bacterium]|nr:type VI secretion system baseplate subunit TssF [Rhodospirillales bacterium]